MKIGFYMNVLSAHQLPLAREVARLVGSDNFVYVTARLQGQGFQTVNCQESWVTTDKSALERCHLVLTGLRDFDFFEYRQRAGLKTFYTSERWFKPIRGLPGSLRLIVPSYRRLAHRFANWLNNDPHARYLAIGPWAKKDALKMGIDTNKILDWGYFVDKGTGNRDRKIGKVGQPLKVLWVGRMLDWKRVDTIIRAVAEVAKHGTPITLTLVGSGPEEAELKKLASSFQHNTSTPSFTFNSPVPLAQVRECMNTHDIYILSSNGEEGWGAALNEALEEGMCALGTYEAGASAVLLPESNLFHAGDWRMLAHKLQTLDISPQPMPEAFTARGAARRLIDMGEYV